MPKALEKYVLYVDAVNKLLGRVTMYLVFVMMAILLYSSISRTVFNSPVIWAVELSQFTMAAYYLLGGGFSMILRAHVRMDVLYSKWQPRTRARMDIVTSAVLLFYLVVLLYGGISSTAYSLQYSQRNYSAWAPLLSPVKIAMVIGIFMMLLQAVSNLIKDVARMKGIDVGKTMGDILP